jgi:hypothetical protein
MVDRFRADEVEVGRRAAAEGAAADAEIGGAVAPLAVTRTSV